ncbi:BrnA antitoxin family protein [Thermodesulfobacteriota bacterium]
MLRPFTAFLVLADGVNRRSSLQTFYNFKNGKRGQVISQKGKTRITIYIDTDVLEEFRARADSEGFGYQTMINEALRKYLEKHDKPLNC